MKYRIVWRGQARSELKALYEWIAAEAGEPVALAYTNSIEAQVGSLATFPFRGSRRDEVRPGLRTIGYRRKTVIAYCVEGSQVVILDIIHGRKDLVGMFDDVD